VERGKQEIGKEEKEEVQEVEDEGIGYRYADTRVRRKALGEI
jgi:hypothetical protein